MKAVSTKEIKLELETRNYEDILALCLRLSRFKKENKELLTYLLFESENERSYIEKIKLDIDEQFEDVNTKTFYFMKKGLRKILSGIKKTSRYSPKKETEVELLIYYCGKLKKIRPSIFKNLVLTNLYNTQVASITKKLANLHEDLQYDFEQELQALKNI